MDEHHCCHRMMQPKNAASESEEVSSIEWKAINMTEQEEELVYRMYKLIGARWALIAGRIPGRTPQEIERFWIMRQREEGSSEKK